VSTAVTTAEAKSSHANQGHTSRPCSAASQVAPMTASLVKKPTSGTTPASAPKPMLIVRKVSGSLSRSPPIAVIDVEPTACTTAPAARNSSALNAPCASRCSTPADQAPTASAPNM
jgi:hypothetical protein